MGVMKPPAVAKLQEFHRSSPDVSAAGAVSDEGPPRYKHYSRFIMDTLLKHPSVLDCKTSFVLDRVKATTAVPV